MQQVLWFLYKMVPTSGAFNIGVALRGRSAIALDVLAAAVMVTAERHPPVRTSITEMDGKPTPVTAEHGMTTTPSVRNLPSATDEELRRAVYVKFITVFALREEGAFRFVLLGRARIESVLLIRGHHIPTDATSNTVLMGGLLDVYDRLAHNDGNTLFTPTATYAGEAELLPSDRAERLERYRRGLYDGLLAAELPQRANGADRGPRCAAQPRYRHHATGRCPAKYF
ncbi:condensation domain-containing protein [Nocardia sp. NBC_01499]|uniref:condensation domain-containing protein n=1 Tax=Nocardia sp. NBC_01499 TaxID=2903597 RepID=UPI00386E3F44